MDEVRVVACPLPGMRGNRRLYEVRAPISWPAEGWPWFRVYRMRFTTGGITGRQLAPIGGTPVRLPMNI